MQGIYNYIPETSHVSTVHSVAAVLVLTICVTCYVVSHIKYVLYVYISTFIIVIIIIIISLVKGLPPPPVLHPFKPKAIPTAQSSSFTLQHFPYYVCCSTYSCLL